MNFKTREDAEKYAAHYNMGSDYQFAYVVQDGDIFLVKIS